MHKLTKCVVPFIQGFEDEVFTSLEGIIKNYNINTIIAEVKKVRDVGVKRSFINKMIDMGYKVYSYIEQYDQTRLVKQSKYAVTSSLRAHKWFLLFLSLKLGLH